MSLLSATGALVLLLIGSLFACAHILYWSGHCPPQTLEESTLDYQERLAERQLLQDIDRPWTVWGYCGLATELLALLLIILHQEIDPITWACLGGALFLQSATLAWRARNAIEFTPTLEFEKHC